MSKLKTLDSQPTKALPNFSESRLKEKQFTEMSHSFTEKFQLQQYLPKDNTKAALTQVVEE